MPEPTVDVSAFREAMSSFPTGVTVVTVASDDGNVHGTTVNSFSSVSLDPMLVLVVALVHRPQLAPLIFHAGTYKSLEREPLLQVAQDAESPAQNWSTAAADGETAVISWRSVRASPVADAARLVG